VSGVPFVRARAWLAPALRHHARGEGRKAVPRLELSRSSCSQVIRRARFASGNDSRPVHGRDAIHRNHRWIL